MSSRPLDNSNPTIIARPAPSHASHTNGGASDAKSQLRRMWRDERAGLRRVRVEGVYAIPLLDGDEDGDGNEDEEEEEEEEEVRTPEEEKVAWSGGRREKRDEIDADEVYDSLTVLFQSRHITYGTIAGNSPVIISPPRFLAHRYNRPLNRQSARLQSLLSLAPRLSSRLAPLAATELLRHITDPEHPLTLEQLAVVSRAQVHVYDPPLVAPVMGVVGVDGAEGMTGAGKAAQQELPRQGHVFVEFTPTIPHCSMATLIGLTLRVRLMRSLPARYKIDIRIKEGMHQSENAVNKQLNDKERVHAALENTHLLSVVEGCLGSADTGRVGEAPVAA